MSAVDIVRGVARSLVEAEGNSEMAQAGGRHPGKLPEAYKPHRKYQNNVKLMISENVPQRLMGLDVGTVE
ncbi:MAG: hypothetical protein CM1200mP15_16610 [Dehalococcoidia bacterium]|nr:MAG: hypothetical protein CM1200mP15_16610 [Dehalococcoidia bacterium]